MNLIPSPKRRPPLPPTHQDAEVHRQGSPHSHAAFAPPPVHPPAPAGVSAAAASELYIGQYRAWEAGQPAPTTSPPGESEGEDNRPFLNSINERAGRDRSPTHPGGQAAPRRSTGEGGKGNPAVPEGP
eukprot:2019877-Heterocapsa_arctica.AAC.1